MSESRPRVIVAGGGTAGLEALLALSALATDRVEITLISPQPDFLYKPLLVEEPFGLGLAERHELAPLAEELGARFVRGLLSEVRPNDHRVVLDDNSERQYDYLVVCAGGRLRPSLGWSAITFPGPESLEIDRLIKRASRSRSGTLAFVAPVRASWPLPIYELALMSERRSRELGVEVRIVVVTAERAPLALFGEQASATVSELLSSRGIEIESEAPVKSYDGSELVLVPWGRTVDAQVVVALAEIVGPRIVGLPMDEEGFIPIDDHARVVGVDDVFAAGDGTNFPVKQGGLAAQQADAAAASISAAVGGSVRDPAPFDPILRGKLLTGDESLHMRSELAGGRGCGQVSADCLWWPSQKIAGKYLAAWLGHEEPDDLEPRERPLDVEVALPREWHEQPIALDPEHLPLRG